MDRKAAKELLHIEGWLERVDEIIQRGTDAYLADELLQEAGDSLMMKLGEAANRLSRLDVLAPHSRIRATECYTRCILGFVSSGALFTPAIVVAGRRIGGVRVRRRRCSTWRRPTPSELRGRRSSAADIGKHWGRRVRRARAHRG